jgi:hypothetical protein
MEPHCYYKCSHGHYFVGTIDDGTCTICYEICDGDNIITIYDADYKEAVKAVKQQLIDAVNGDL